MFLFGFRSYFQILLPNFHHTCGLPSLPRTVTLQSMIHSNSWKRFLPSVSCLQGTSVVAIFPDNPFARQDYQFCVLSMHRIFELEKMAMWLPFSPSGRPVTGLRHNCSLGSAVEWLLAVFSPTTMINKTTAKPKPIIF